MIQELDTPAYGNIVKGVQTKHDQLISVQGDAVRVQGIHDPVPIEVGCDASPALEGLLALHPDNVWNIVEVAIQAGQAVAVGVRDVFLPHAHRENQAGAANHSIGRLRFIRYLPQLHEQVGELLHDGWIPLVGVGGLPGNRIPIEFAIGVQVLIPMLWLIPHAEPNLL